MVTIDGNKRTAALTFRVICRINDLKPNPDISLDALAVYIEKTQEQDHQFVIKSISVLLFDKLSQIG